MIGCSHVVQVERVSLFRSRRGHVNRARAILPRGEELEFLTSGSGFFQHDGVETPVARGHVLWHLPGEYTVDRFPSDDPYECLVVRFEVTGEPRRQVPRVTSWSDPGEAAQFATEILRAYHRGGYDPTAFAQYVYGRFLWHSHLAAIRPPAPSLPEPLREALAIIDQRFQRPLGVEELAGMVGYSTAHLHDLFRRHLAQSPHQLLTERRLERARRLLATTEQPVRQIASLSGFPDAVTFIRAFKRSVGQTPMAYRKAHSPPVD